MILVPLLNPKFANTLAARWCELRVRGTSGRVYRKTRIRRLVPAIAHSDYWLLAFRAGFFSACTAGRGFAAPLRLAAARRGVVDTPFPPVRAARASKSPMACSSVTVSGEMSEGSVALTPSWLT